MRDVPSHRGPGGIIRLTERALRKRNYLDQDERILEWKQGRVQRWLVDGSDKPIPKLYGLERIPILSGMASLSYSPRMLFFVGTDSMFVTDLAFIVRVWHTEPRSVCIIYSSFDDQSDGQLVSARWIWGERERFDEVTEFADRIRVRAKERLAGLTGEWQARVKNRVSEATASASFESELALLDEDAAGAARLRPRTVVGLWLRAAALGMREERMREERNRLVREVNGGQPGWNSDEPGVIEAASELAARRYFGPQASAEQVTALAAQMQEMSRTGAAQRGGASNLPEVDYVEQVIRYATGDHGAALESNSVAFHVRAAFVVFVFMELDIMFELDKLICDAEALAFERGLNPPLAARLD